MPSTITLSSGAELRVDQEPEDATSIIAATTGHFVTLQAGGKDLRVRPEHVAAISAASGRSARSG